MKYTANSRQSKANLQHRANRILAYGCELAGTTLVITNGLILACWLFGAGSPILQWFPNRPLRVLLEAFLAAVLAIIITYSPLGKRSGGHLNPAMTLGFWLLNKISTQDALAYTLMQFLGAFIGTLLVRSLFPGLVHSIKGGVTLLSQGIEPAFGFGLELGMTFLVMLIVLASVNSRWKQWSGVISETVYIGLYINAAPLTGASLNPARSLAPAALIMFWENQWIYWLGPPLGASLAVLLYRQGFIGSGKSYCCKLYHTDEIPCHHVRCGYGNSAYIDDFSGCKRH
jgi:aquaporin Z